jgi:hypothetical protein
MAARTSAGSGMLITVGVTSVLALAMFVTTIVFFAQSRAANQQVQALSTNVAEIVREDERNRDDVSRLRQVATQQRKSLVGYLVQSQQDIMQKVTGSGRDTLEDLNKKLGEDFTAVSVLSAFQEQKGEIASLTKRVTDAEDNATRALADKEAEVRRVKDIEESQRKTLEALNAEVDQYKGEIDQLRDELAGFKGELDTRVQRMRDEFAGKETQLAAEIDKLQRQSLLDKSLIQRLQDELKGQRFAGQAEEALVDGSVIGLNAADGTVVISVGRSQRLVLGTSFEVYSEPTAIRPDPAGNYPQGKASLEVIRLDSDSATCRVLREKRGNPVVRGDVIANALYDPKKTYTFLVYGTFDANKDGRATVLEAGDIEALIKNWGGGVVAEMTGNVDFVVLGDRPSLPPEPGATAPAEVVQEFIRLKRQAVRYDEILAQARSTSIPVLNENRLYTLTGLR